MQNVAGGGASVQSGAQNDVHHSIVADLKSLIEQVQASTKLIDFAIAGETSAGNQDVASTVVVLDDVTPRYVKARAALSACNAGLGMALNFLLDAKASRHEADETGRRDCGPVRLIGRA